jgi:hypothetical protein
VVADVVLAMHKLHSSNLSCCGCTLYGFLPHEGKMLALFSPVLASSSYMNCSPGEQAGLRPGVLHACCMPAAGWGSSQSRTPQDQQQQPPPLTMAAAPPPPRLLPQAWSTPPWTPAPAGTSRSWAARSSA